MIVTLRGIGAIKSRVPRSEISKQCVSFLHSDENNSDALSRE
jgi:hypothetical protein